MENIKKQIHETIMEYDKRGMKGAADVDHIYKLMLSLWLMKDLGMDMEEEYSHDGYSGRRDSMGRYSRNSYDGGSSYEGGGYSGRRGYSRDGEGGGYSGHGPDELMQALKHMERNAQGREKEVIERMMRMAEDL